MGRHLQYTSIDRVISKVYNDTGLENLSETRLVEWIGEALDALEVITLLEETIAFIEVKNHQAELPSGLHSIIQIARNNKWTKKTETNICPINIIKDVVENTDCSDKMPVISPVPLDCKGTPIVEHELAYYRPYFDLQYEYSGWMKSPLYQQNYTPVRLANHTFFGTVVCEEDPKIYNPNCSSMDEYTLEGNTIKFSFKEGSIAMAYYRQKLDSETGYPMIPDDISILNAIVYYVIWKYMARMWYLGREGYADKMKEAEQQWQWYCKQAGDKQMMLYGIDQHQNFTDGRFQLIPRKNKYYEFFGKLGREEYTGFKDPNRRNFRLRGI